MAMFWSHAAAGSAVTAIGLASLNAHADAYSIVIVSLAGLRTAWPDLSMVIPSIKAALKAKKQGDPKWYKVRDWTQYDYYHHMDARGMDPYIALHVKVIDPPFHKIPGESWYRRLWWLDTLWFVGGGGVTYLMFRLMG